ncbi:MAG: hypothetical protein KKD69_05520, partial [Euryarchaeota archaeon]|nr:hypothetical protein [Euryarchaeota archaeon]
WRKSDMNKKKIFKKIIPFWKDTEAISPVVATILVLAVAVAAGLGLYLWFNPFQANVQASVQNSSISSTNIMASKSMGSEVLMAVLPKSTFVYKSNLDVDNDGKIYRPGTSGNYSLYDPAYTNKWNDERFIQEIMIYIENRGPSQLTGVKIQYTEVPGLHGLLRLDRNNNNQLLDVNGTAVHVMFDQTGVTVNQNYSYYFSESAGIMELVSGLDYTIAANNKAYLPIKTDTFAHNRILSMNLYDVDGNSRNAIAKIDGIKTGWNTAVSFYTGTPGKNWGLNKTIYDWFKENVQTPTYEVGILKPGESKRIYTYYYIGSMNPTQCTKGDSFADCTLELPITVSSDQGATQALTAKLHIVDTTFYK